MTRQEILKNAKPILFNTEMVRAILDGRKTVTRRVVKVPNYYPHFYKLHDNTDGAITGQKNRLYAGFYNDEKIFYIDGEKLVDAVYYKAPCETGDILYVRETWSPLHQDKDSKDVCGYMYKACTLEEYDKMYPDGKDYQWEGKWHPSIHMPKEAARVFLKVTNVRVERLQDAKYFDFINEGIPYKQYECEIREDFQKLWNYTIKKSDLYCYGWDANPWVWVIEFERIEV